MTQILGLQFDRPFLRAALLRKERSEFKICALKSAPLTSPENVKQLYRSKFKGRLAFGLSSKQLMIRFVELNVQKTRHIEEAFMLRHEGTHFFNADEIMTIPYGIKKREKTVSALLFTVSKETLKTSLEECDQLGAVLDSVSANALSLVHFVRWIAPSLKDAVIIDLGFQEWTAVSMEEGELKKTHAIEHGTQKLLGALWEDRKKILLPKEVEGIAKQIDLLQIKPHLNPDLSSKLNQMRQELAKIIFSFSRAGSVKPIVFTGHIDAFLHLKEFLLISLKESISEEFSPPWSQEEQKYAIPIGLAIEQTEKPLQLLQKEFFPKKHWRKAGSYALLLFLLSIFSSACFTSSTVYELKNREQQILEKLEPSLKRWGIKSHDNPHDASLKWQKVVSESRKEFPYILQAPRVSEVLSWLSHHPLVGAFKKEDDSLEVSEMRYQLLESPKIDALNTRYLAKVDLRFIVKSPMNARKFHEALLKGDEIVDANQEITWETLSDGYRVSFFLKNAKVPYVP